MYLQVCLLVSHVVVASLVVAACLVVAYLVVVVVVVAYLVVVAAPVAVLSCCSCGMFLLVSAAAFDCSPFYTTLFATTTPRLKFVYTARNCAANCQL